MPSLSELIERLKKTDEGSHDLDVLIYRALGIHDEIVSPYTTSIDAAMQLVEANLPPSKSYGKTDTGEGWKIGFYRYLPAD